MSFPDVPSDLVVVKIHELKELIVRIIVATTVIFLDFLCEHPVSSVEEFASATDETQQKTEDACSVFAKILTPSVFSVSAVPVPIAESGEKNEKVRII